LLDEYGGRVSVEQLIIWLDQIGNHAAWDALSSEYDSTKFVFDPIDVL